MIAGAVLCGGASRRMGTDKALVEVAGVPMAERVAAALAGAGCTPVVLVGGGAALAVLGRPVVPDEHPGAGPGGGILTALTALDAPGTELVVVAACDLPLLDAATVRAVADPVRNDPTIAASVAVVAAEDRAQRSLTCWRRPGVVATLRAAWDRGARGIGALLAAVPHAEVEVPADAVRNVNTPAERNEAERRARYREPVPIQEIDVDGLAERLAAGGRVVDVREPDEYAAGHVPGAIHVPLATVPDRVDAFLGDGPTYVICRSGGRSMRACEYLAAQGIDGLEVVNVAGGTMAWIASGRDVVAGDQPS